MIVLNDTEVDKQKIVDIPGQLVNAHDLEQLDNANSTYDTSLAG